MSKNIFTTDTSKGSEEYCCSIVRIGELRQIEGSDYLMQTEVDNNTVVVRKTDVAEGQVMFYAPIGSALCERFLRVNNMYDVSERDLNANAEEVNVLMDAYHAAKDSGDMETAEKKHAEAKAMVGFFNRYGQVRSLRLRGIFSCGFLFGVQEMVNFLPEISGVNLESLVGTDFNMVNGESFIFPFDPSVKEKNGGRRRSDGKNARRPRKRLNRHNRIVGDGIVRHYDTMLLTKPRNLAEIHPDDTIAVSTKIHGTSFIIGNIKVRKPKYGGIYTRLYLGNHLPKFLRKETITDDVVYSTRNNVINNDMNPEINHSRGDVTSIRKYTEYYELLRNSIPEGMTLYGEIFGYLTGKKDKYIQKNYDYGCEPGTNKFMIYRITMKESDGTTTEYDIEDVIDFTQRLVNNCPELADRILCMEMLYHGKAGDMYPEIKDSEDWNQDFLNSLKKDTSLLHMEEKEPMCKNNVCREGIVIRIDGDKTPRAFKLKSMRFLEKEQKDIDSGKFVDTEMQDAHVSMDEDGDGQ